MQFELIFATMIALGCVALKPHHHRSRHHRSVGHLHSPTNPLFAENKFVVLRPTNLNARSAEVTENHWGSQEANKILYDHLFFPLIPIENAGLKVPELSPGKHAIKFGSEDELNIHQQPNDIKSALKKILMRIDN